MGESRKFVCVYLFGLLLAGLVYLALTPPFEGFDEYAHYSSIRQMATTNTLPLLGQSYLDRAVVDYEGPLSYDYLKPPFENGVSYGQFFADPDRIEHYKTTYRDAALSQPFMPSDQANWQAQHPPLYYLLMTPLARATAAFSLVTQLFVLRLASFLLALGGVAFGMCGVMYKQSAVRIHQITLGFSLYPLLFPMFFQEFVRLGNDSLCLFLFGLIIYLLALQKEKARPPTFLLLIGCVLGLGLLTKAFFLAITGSLVGALLSAHGGLRSAQCLGDRFKKIGTMLVPAVLLGGGWYFYKLIAFGELTASVDTESLARHGGLLAGLSERFSCGAFIAAFLSIAMDDIWSATRSIMEMPLLPVLPLVVLVATLLAKYIQQMKRTSKTDFDMLLIWTFLFFAAGLAYHVFVTIALDGVSLVPGWYLQILMPLIAPALGVGYQSLARDPYLKPFIVGGICYAGLFQITTLWAQLTLFTGCALKVADNSYGFRTKMLCLDQTPVLLGRLSIMGWPLTALIGFLGALLCAFYLFWRLRYNGYVGQR